MEIWQIPEWKQEIHELEVPQCWRDKWHTPILALRTQRQGSGVSDDPVLKQNERECQNKMEKCIDEGILK